jgi:hypothetical protein
LAKFSYGSSPILAKLKIDQKDILKMKSAKIIDF